jgi:protein tyrosine/serine phosphatase
MGAIAPRRLYRSSHPVTGDDKDFIIAELAEAAQIADVINLADDERTLKQKADLVPWHNKLFQEGCVIALDMGFNFRSGKFGDKLNQGVKFIIEHKGPYLVHCMQGIDRTGFFVMLLEMLMGADKDEITNDYMTSFLGRPEFGKRTVYYKREYSNFSQVLRELNGGKQVTDKSLPRMAERYFFGNAGLIQSELDQLRMALSKKQEQGYDGQNFLL